jgi:hypothetical protein
MPNLVANACRFLASLQRLDLRMLLAECDVSVEQRRSAVEIDLEWYPNVVSESVIVRAPAPIDEALAALPPQDRKRIAEAVASGVSSSPTTDDIYVESLPNARVDGAPALLSELLIQRSLMISVATGGDRIQDVDDYYRAREARIRQNLPEEVEYPNPHKDLWEWYHHWDTNFGQYKERRHYIRQLFGSAIDTISRRSNLLIVQREATGWEKVDRALSKARAQLDRSSAEEDFQGVGLICREVLISLAQAVYDPSEHQSVDGVSPSSTDANRMLEAFVAHEFPGESYKEVRAHARASLALALNLQHRRTATRQLAALCVEATASTVAVVSIIARSRN